MGLIWIVAKYRQFRCWWHNREQQSGLPIQWAMCEVCKIHYAHYMNSDGKFRCDECAYRWEVITGRLVWKGVQCPPDEWIDHS